MEIMNEIDRQIDRQRDKGGGREKREKGKPVVVCEIIPGENLDSSKVFQLHFSQE